MHFFGRFSNVYNYFKNRTIVGSEYTLDRLDTTSYVGTILTNETSPTSFINSNVWGSDSELRFSNSDLDTLTYVSMNRYISFSSPEDFMELEFTYDNSVSEQVIVGSDTGSSLSISSGELSLYVDGGELISTIPFSIPNNSNTSVSITSKVNILGGSVTKGLDFKVNNRLTRILDLGGKEINFKSFAGMNGRVGLNGTIGKININGDIFRLLEGSGKNIFKTI